MDASISWEGRSRPIFARSQVVDVADDRGFTLEDLRGQGGGSQWLTPLDGHQASTWHTESVPITMPAMKLVRYTLSVEFDFALHWWEVKFENPLGTPGAGARCEGFTAKMGSFGRSLGLGAVDLDLTLTALRERLAPTTYDWIWIRGKSGKEFCASPREIDPSSGDRRYVVTMENFYEAGDDSPLEELSIRVPLEIHTEHLVAELKDIPLK